MARVLWRTVQIAFNITPPNSVMSLFGMWLVGIESETARQIRVGACALLWQFGTAEIIWLLTEQQIFIFCRFYSELLRRSVYGRYSLRRRPGSVWLLGLFGGRWWRGISSTGLDGGHVIG